MEAEGERIGPPSARTAWPRWLDHPRSPLRDARVAALVSALLAFLVYANSLGNGFAYDDVPIIAENETIQSWSRLGRAIFSSYWPGPAGLPTALWRPVTTALLGIQHVITGGHPLLFHLVNVLTHAGATGLLVLLVAELGTVAVALVAGLLFAVHPVHTEAVANVVGVAELVSAAALLAACLLHARGPEVSGWRRALTIGLLYVIGFGAKESGVTLPGLVFLVDAARRDLTLRDVPAYVARRWRLYFVLLVVATGMLVARLHILGNIASPAGPLGAHLLAEIPRIWTLGEVWANYVRLWVLPLDLFADYSPNVIPISFGWRASNVAGVVAALLVLVATLVLWRRPELRPGGGSARLAAFGVVWFVVAISPVSNTVFLSGVVLAERTLYLPTAGLAAATGWLFVRAARARPRVVPGALVVLLLAWGARTWERNPVWRDNQRLFNRMLLETPHSGRSQWIMGDAFMNVGAFEQAMRSYAAAVGLLDAHYQLLTHVAGQMMEHERWKAADGLLEHAWRDVPRVALALGLRAGVRAEIGDAAGAERFARASLAITSRDRIRAHVLAWALASRGAWEEATEARRRADELGEVGFWQRWIYDAWVHEREGRPEAACAALDSATAAVRYDAGRIALDRVITGYFGLDPRFPELSARAPDDTGRSGKAPGVLQNSIEMRVPEPPQEARRPMPCR